MSKSSSPRNAPSRSPSQLGYRMPAEWEPHAATWLSWPHNPDTWLCGLEPVERFFCQMVEAIGRDEHVHINVQDTDAAQRARHKMADAGIEADVTFHLVPTNDAWCRDHGAIVVTQASLGGAYPNRIAINWGYNAWGGKYPPFDRDDAVPQRMAAALGTPLVSGGMILEGGSIDVNGAGDLLTTESCLLHPNRNPSMTRTQIEERLRCMLGVTNIVWLSDGIEGDDTDGHVDDLTRFVSPHRVVTVIENDPTDVNFHPLQDNLRRLRAARRHSGHAFDIVTLPMPRPIFYDGRRLPASYANFYFTNRSLLVPTFDQPSDTVALQILSTVVPDRRVVGIRCLDVITGLGAIHCLTQQIPAS